MSEVAEETITLRLTWTDYARTNLAKRTEEFKRHNHEPKLDDVTASILFLRGTAARASFVLPALYLVLGAYSQPEDPARPHWQAVEAKALEQSGLHTIALACRAIFDGGTSGLRGGRIAQLTDESLESVAKHWANKSKRLEEAIKALTLLRRLFARCARPSDILLEQPSLLEPRIGLLKYYANRQAAHITMGHYLFDPVLDVVHVGAAIVLIGGIIAEFDDPQRVEARYFDSVDEGAWQSAKRLFPNLPERVFNSFNIHRHATVMWKSSHTDGVEYILNQLPSAIGYWDSELDHQDSE